MANQSKINKTKVVIALLVLSLVPHIQNYNSHESFLFDLYFIFVLCLTVCSKDTRLSPAGALRQDGHQSKV